MRSIATAFAVIALSAAPVFAQDQPVVAGAGSGGAGGAGAGAAGTVTTVGTTSITVPEIVALGLVGAGALTLGFTAGSDGDSATGTR